MFFKSLLSGLGPSNGEILTPTIVSSTSLANMSTSDNDDIEIIEPPGNKTDAIKLREWNNTGAALSNPFTPHVTPHVANGHLNVANGFTSKHPKTWMFWAKQHKIQDLST